MEINSLQILLADDDEDDCYFFKQALQGFPMPVNLTAVNNGEQLMENLNDSKIELPQILFLDLNMPKKNGFECLLEIKENKKFKQIPVVIFSTSFEQEVVKLLYDNGAQYYIRKPAEIKSYKSIIKHAITLITNNQSADTNNLLQPYRVDFILTVDNALI
jgi:CheY-like chemotaxis protein